MWTHNRKWVYLFVCFLTPCQIEWVCFAVRLLWTGQQKCACCLIFFFPAGQEQTWATGYLLSSTKAVMLKLFSLAQHQNIVPRGEQYAHWGSKWDGRTYGVSFRLSSWTCQLWFQRWPSFLSSVSFTPSLEKPLTLAVCSYSAGLLSGSLKPRQDKWTDILDVTLWPWQKGQIQYSWRVTKKQSSAFGHTWKIHSVIILN